MGLLSVFLGRSAWRAKGYWHPRPLRRSWLHVAARDSLRDSCRDGLWDSVRCACNSAYVGWPLVAHELSISGNRARLCLQVLMPGERPRNFARVADDMTHVVSLSS